MIVKKFNGNKLRLLKFSKHFSYFSINSSREAFNTIMSCLDGDIEMGRSECNFINTCFAVRDKVLSEKWENDILIRPRLTVTQYGRHSIRPKRLDL